MKKTFEYVHASQVFDDNNGGLVYGINWIYYGEIIDCEWHRTKKDRDNSTRGMEGVR